MHRIHALTKLTLAAALVAGTAFGAPRAARADVSLTGGAYAGGGRVTGGGAASFGFFATPIVPLSTELTVAAPFDGQGYAVTADARFSPLGTTIGAGIGFGNLNAVGRTSVLYDAILGHTLIPHLSVEGRLYFGPGRPSSILAGLRLSL